MAYSAKILEGNLFISVPVDMPAWREFYTAWKNAFDTTRKDAERLPNGMKLKYISDLTSVRAGHLASVVGNRVFEEVLEDREKYGLDMRTVHDALIKKRHVTFTLPDTLDKKELEFLGYTVYFEPSTEHEFPGYKWPDQQIEAYQSVAKTPEDLWK